MIAQTLKKGEISARFRGTSTVGETNVRLHVDNTTFIQTQQRGENRFVVSYGEIKYLHYD